MKKLNFLLGLGIITLGALFTSCNKDETAKPPTINFKGGGDYISTDSTLIVGESFVVGINATPNTESEKKLTQLIVTRTFSNIPNTVIDTTFSDALQSLNLDIYLTANIAVGAERFTFKVVDKEGESAEIAINITTEEGVLPIVEKDNITMDAQADGPNTAANNNSFLSTSDGLLFTLNEINSDAENEAKVDIMFMRHTIYKVAYPDFSLRSPDNSGIEDYFGAVSQTYSTTGKNTTKLKLVTASVDWDNLDNDGIIAATSDVESGTGIVDELDNGDIIAFVTESGKRGLIRVVEVIPGTTYAGSDMKIDYKVQQ